MIDAGDGETSLPEEERIAREAGEFEDNLYRQHPGVWWGTLLGPFVLTGLILVGFYVIGGAATAQRLLGTAAATFFFFGKFVILGGVDRELAEVRSGFTAEQLFAIVFYMDLMTAVVLVSHMGFLFRIPWLGKRLVGLVADGRTLLRSNPWMKRATFLGIVAFVMFPLASTGSVGGAIFGRLLGMSRTAAFTAIAIGSFLGCAVMYLGAGLINRYVDRDDPILFYGGVGFVVGLIVILNVRYRRAVARERSPS